MKFRDFVAALLLCPVTLSAAQTEIPEVSGDMVVDGVLDEPFWAQAAVIELDLETDPGENIPARVRTRALVVDSGTSLRIAFDAQDPEPDQIRAAYRDRDSAFDDDFVGINVDTFNAQRRAYEFYINPLGAQMDLIYDESRRGNEREDASWDASWTSAGQITDTGYIVEFEIPYDILRFEKGDGVKSWAIDFVRFRPRDQRYRYSNTPKDRGNNCYLCGLGTISGFANADPGRNLSLTPTLTSLSNKQRDQASDPISGSGLRHEFGLDARWSPTPNLTLNATLNPDFSQVETDTAQLDINSTFALFFPEKRPFFLEGADYFQTPTQLVYTRNVADPDIGARVTGRSGANTYGMFIARDAVTGYLQPGALQSEYVELPGASDVLVGRIRHDLNSSSSIGGIVTSRSGENYSNNLVGVDTLLRSGAKTVTAQLVLSETEDPLFNSGERFSGYSALLDLNHSVRDYWWAITGEQHNSGFRADLGFINQVDFRKFEAKGGPRWYFDANENFIHTIRTRFSSGITHRVEDSILLERENEGFVTFEGRQQTRVNFGAVFRDRFWDGTLFEEEFFIADYDVQAWAGIIVGFNYRTGQQVDFANTDVGDVERWQPRIRGSIGQSFSASIHHLDETMSRDGDLIYRAKVTDLRGAWQFDLKHRLRLSLQRRTVQRNQLQYVDSVDRYRRSIGSQLVYSYKIDPLTALYLGYSDGYFGEDDQSTYQNTRTFFMKISFGWQP